MLAHAGIYGNEMADVEAKKGRTNKNKIQEAVRKDVTQSSIRK